MVGKMSKFGEDFLVGEQNKFGEDGERLREDRASFLLGLASGLQVKSVRREKLLPFYLSASRLSKVTRHWIDLERRGEIEG